MAQVKCIHGDMEEVDVWVTLIITIWNTLDKYILIIKMDKLTSSKLKQVDITMLLYLFLDKHIRGVDQMLVN